MENRFQEFLNYITQDINSPADWMAGAMFSHLKSRFGLTSSQARQEVETWFFNQREKEKRIKVKEVK